MAGQYETYLARLKKIKQSRPEMDVYNRTMQEQSKPFNLMNKSVARITQQGGASTGAQVAALNQGREQWNQTQTGAYNTAVNATVQRNENLDMKIAEVEAANEAQKQAEAIAKGESKAGAIRTGLTIAGTIAGAFAGSPQAGAAIGEAAGGFVGVDTKGNLSVNPEDWDTQRILQGLGNTVGSLAVQSNEKKMQNANRMIAENTALIQQEFQDNPDGAAGLIMQMQMYYNAGDTESMSTMMNQIKQRQADRTASVSDQPFREISNEVLDGGFRQNTGGDITESESAAVTQPSQSIAAPDQDANVSVSRQDVLKLYRDNGVSDADLPTGMGIMEKALSDGLVYVNDGGSYSWSGAKTTNPTAKTTNTGNQMLAYYTDVDERKEISKNIGAGSYEVKKNGNFSVSGQNLVMFVGKTAKTVRDVTGQPIKAKIGDTIIVNADGSIEIRRK
ncbi:MAG TPA: hypothetical protein PL124_09775 [Candidatus Cloacimonadota bacterium]|nr:hypothetical protein [Candidatus Cloacimonadota bacterium]